MNGRHYRIQIERPAAPSKVGYIAGDEDDVAAYVAVTLAAERVTAIKVRPISEADYVAATRPND